MGNTFFIQQINLFLQNIIGQYPGSKVYAELVESVILGSVDSPYIVPCLINKSGEAEYVGIDDTCPMMIYHKSNSIISSDKVNSGYGDGKALKNYVYSNVLIIGLNGDLIKILPDEMVLFIEANMPDSIKYSSSLLPMRGTFIRTDIINLNTMAVFESEYKNSSVRLPLNYHLFSISYKIDTVFDKKCLQKCP